MVSRSLLNYAFAIAATLVALLLMLVLDPLVHLEQASFLLFFGAVTLTALYAGRGPAIVTTILSAVLSSYFFLQPQYSWRLDLAGSIRVTLFITQGLLISFLVGALRQAQQQSEKTLQQLQISETEIKRLNQELQVQVAELLLTEKTLRESEQRFRRLVESNLFGVGFSKSNGEMYYANDYFLNLVGYSREDLWAGRIRWRDMTPPEFLPLDQQADQELRVTGVATPFEKEYIRKDGSRVPILIGVASSQEPFNQSQETICFYIDLTERRQAEAAWQEGKQRERKARTEAEAANRAKDEFLAVLSHELRSPLNPILGWARLLQTQKLDDAKVTQALKTIERNARLQTELIEDLLDVSRILQGKLNLNLSSVDLNATIQAAIETVQLAAEAKSIQIKTSLEPDLENITGDLSRLQQIVWNLLSNAVKFTPEGGQVEVRLEKVISLSLTYAQITVSDTGKGISNEFLPYVFEYFRQADFSTTRKFGGLGLGLAIVRHLVELHGGNIWAESPGEGLGATFTVQLPLNTRLPQTTLLREAPQQLPGLTGIKVLVVDDETDSRELVTFLLEQAGAIVLTATSALEALLALAQSQPDILLSDIGMPDIDGYQLMQEVRSLPPENGGLIPAIALTAYAGEFDQRQAFKAGFQKHITKPVELEQLIRAIVDLVISDPSQQ